MNPEQPLFEEKQYLGYNAPSTVMRLSLALFCFGLYWWKIHNNQNGDLFFFMGMAVILISILLLFILHIKIRVYRNRIELDGLWTTRKVNIDLKNIIKIERKRYSRYHFNNPVFNLHLKGVVRFYTGGSDAIELTPKSGEPYRIGTQKPVELEKILKELTVA